MRVSALIVCHGAGKGAELVGSLARHLPEGGSRVGVFHASDVGDGTSLEPFMHEVAATDEVRLVHMIQPEDPDQLATELRSEIIQPLLAVENVLRQRFPALVGVASWVLVDLGRKWSDSARSIAGSILEIAEENRIRSVLAVTGSTAGSVAGDVEDRAGMLADAAWNLAVGNLGETPGFKDQIRVWAVSSRSFTVNTEAWVVIAASKAVVKAIDDGPLRATSEGMLDQSKQRAADWVASRGIGTEQERAQILNGPQGDATQMLSADRNAVVNVTPSDWATAIDREYLRLAGAPLARYTRIVEGNATALACGRAGDTYGGHLRAFDDAATTQLRESSGCLRAARFVNGTADALRGAARNVANLQHIDPNAIKVDQKRRDLELAVSRLASVRPWIVRLSLFVLVVAVMVHNYAWWLAALLPLASAGLLGWWGAHIRLRAVRAREDYVSSVEKRIGAVAMQRLLAAQLELIKRLQSHVGAFVDEHDALVEMEVATPPPVMTRAADVRRIWEDFQTCRRQFDTPELSMQVLEPVPDCGRYFVTFPNAGEHAKRISSTRSKDADERRQRVYDACKAELTELALGWDLERMRSAFTAACVAESTSSTGVSDLQALDPTMASSVAESLAMDNHPLLDKRLVSKEGTVVLTPNQSTPQGFESLLNSAQQSPFIAASGDRRRISVTYLAAQNFEAPVRPDVPEWFHAEPVEESTDADEHAGHEGIGLVDGGI